ncbi:hypothetical protein [Arthrobacter crystallopoietes]|uniref:hypothetical protein n=1 Tax=Crystallibacter crystallopoietes TaxID=37928 RepID=UPI00111340DE|nr:hypothetical protein [Arthrobacter crystallopoietes]
MSGQAVTVLASPADSARWVQLVGELKDKLPKMQETFVERVRAIPEYSGDAVSGEDLSPPLPRRLS